MLRTLIAGALVAAALLTLPAAAGAQAVTRGSPLTAPNNTTFGCDAAPSLGIGNFPVLPAGKPSCSWWSTGPGGTIGNPNSGYVPTTGTITNVRVKSGPNPAPLRLVQLRSVAGCCTVVRQTEPFQPLPNQVTQVTVNWLTEVVRDSVAGVSTNDIIGISANGFTGTLPVSDQGANTHVPQAAFDPGIMGAGYTAPSAQPGSLITAASVGAIGYELLLQYDFVPCPALNNVPVAPGTLVCPEQTTVTPPAANVGPTGPVNPGTPTAPTAIELALGSARLTGSTLPVTLVCGLDAGCTGRLTLLLAAGTRSAQAAANTTLATQKFTMKQGRHQVKVKLSKKTRARLRKKKSTKVTAIVTITGQPKIRKALTVRR
ncbi:MAG: hypothetical protein JHC95_19625 [Solirubrobacteraceae bacterium]|nr:hypothetical protein [Solirubrobacteraceae bacterium]